MKSKTCLILTLLMAVLIMTNGIRHKHRVRKYTRLSPNNVYFRFAQGLVEQMAGNPKDIESCLPGDWKSEASTDTKTSAPSVEGNGGVLEKVLKYLGLAIDVACKFKNDVKDFFKKKLGIRRFRRVYIQLQKVNGQRNPFDDIVNYCKELYQKFKDFLNSPLVKKAIEFVKCLKTIKTAVVGFINTITNFVSNVTKLVSGLAGFIDVTVDLICMWKDFRDAINFLQTGLKATDNLAKWNSYGKFLGKIVHTIGSS